MGEAMSYWDFFPAEDGWAHMPVWGYADVVESRADGVPEGTRVYGYLPPASHLVVRPDRASSTDFVDVSPHRVDLPAAYNRYLRTDGNEMYEKENEDYEILLWPLYFTSFLIDDFLDDEDMFGAKLAGALVRLEPHHLSARPPAGQARRNRGGRPDVARQRRVHRVARRLRPRRPLRGTRLDRGRARRLRGRRRRREGPRRGPRPLGRSAQAQRRRRDHSQGGPRRLRRARRPRPDLLLRSDPPQEALGGLGPRRG